MSENKVVFNINDNGDDKSFEAEIDLTLKGEINKLLQKKAKTGDLYLRNKMEDLCEKHDKMEAKLADLAKSMEQIYQLLNKSTKLN
jgi:hypothetical protein